MSAVLIIAFRQSTRFGFLAVAIIVIAIAFERCIADPKHVSTSFVGVRI